MMTLQDEKGEKNNEPYAPHPVVIVKGSQGFGFNVRGQIDEGGQLKSINGHLYPPLQHISNVIPGGPADVAGVLMGDRILEVNGISVEGESHSRVIELIKSNPDKLRMILMSVPPKENERLDGEAVSYCSEEEFDVKSVDITIPSISQNEESGSKTVSYYNVYLDAKFLCSHRYKAFYNLQTDLKNKFFQFEFPKFPGKWPFQLSQAQLEKRHKDLEQWLIQVCSISQLFNHFYIQDFLGLTNGSLHKTDNDSVDSKHEPDNADIKVFLSNKTNIIVNIPTESYVKELIEAVCEKINISLEFAKHFMIYKSYGSDDLDAALSLADKPLDLYVQNYNESKILKFMFKKFIFSTEIEDIIAEDPVCLNMLYEQAVDDLNNNLFETTGKEIELKRTQHVTMQKDFLKIVHTCPGYNTITFPHCICDSRKDGHVIMSVSQNKIAIQACSTNGEKQDQVKNFSWTHVSDYGCEEELFHFTITKNSSERKITMKSSYADYMSQCFERIAESRDTKT